MIVNKDNFLSSSFLKNFYHFNENDFSFSNFINNKSKLDLSSIYSISFTRTTKLVPDKIDVLLKFGFSFGGILTTYELELSNILVNSHLLPNIRLAKNSDIDELKRIAYHAFEDDKFHHDTKIPNSLADEYYAKWVENSCYGLTDLVWVYEQNNLIQVFITLNYPKNEKDYCQIILNAIDKPYRNQRKYMELLLHTVKDLIEKGFKKLRIGTYESSIAVHKNSKKLYFTPIQYNYIYHYHS